jgi:septal ring-binding cell division protein DamX
MHVYRHQRTHVYEATESATTTTIASTTAATTATVATATEAATATATIASTTTTQQHQQQKLLSNYIPQLSSLKLSSSAKYQGFYMAPISA